MSEAAKETKRPAPAHRLDVPPALDAHEPVFHHVDAANTVAPADGVEEQERFQVVRDFCANQKTNGCETQPQQRRRPERQQ